MYLQDTVRIPLRARDGTVRAYAIVDASDAEQIACWRWNLNGSGYAARCDRSGERAITVLMHRQLLGLVTGDLRQGDHINRDRLDNRRSNLRAVQWAENAQNVASRPGARSAFRGVSWHKATRRWRAEIKMNGQVTYLGYFSTEEEAAETARLARMRLMPFSTD